MVVVVVVVVVVVEVVVIEVVVMEVVVVTCECASLHALKHTDQLTRPASTLISSHRSILHTSRLVAPTLTEKIL